VGLVVGLELDAAGESQVPSSNLVASRLPPPTKDNVNHGQRELWDLDIRRCGGMMGQGELLLTPLS
jgi:hypothetical protein